MSLEKELTIKASAAYLHSAFNLRQEDHDGPILLT